MKMMMKRTTFLIKFRSHSHTIRLSIKLWSKRVTLKNRFKTIIHLTTTSKTSIQSMLMLKWTWKMTSMKLIRTKKKLKKKMTRKNQMKNSKEIMM